MKIGIDIDNVLSNFNEVLLNDYLEHDRTLNNAGIVQKDNKEKSLFNTNPELKKIWNYEKNNGLNPNVFSKGSKLDVWCKCEKGHEWELTISNRTSLKRECPICGRIKMWDTIRKNIEKKNV